MLYLKDMPLQPGLYDHILKKGEVLLLYFVTLKGTHDQTPRVVGPWMKRGKDGILGLLR